uniref:Uncharacterized protein n=1 Tax=Pseudo-nitzschia australis TaxID=44445 RepID=A0A6U9W108_9STRA|mmetsp:Transcript_1418/g.3127  ORF Transcript_1418/g.3127 Transcript_1418/m.3127 type:complete len:370 (-) Transcript_1418:1630-2739(-)
MIQNFKLFIIGVAYYSVAGVSAWIAPTKNLQYSTGRRQSRATATVFHQLQHQHKRRGLVSEHCYLCNRRGDTRLYNKLLQFLSPYDSKIPDELRDDIYKAEANTPAARDRGKRVAIYTTMAIFGIILASFNGFLTDMRDKETAINAATAATSIADPESPNSLYILEVNGFGWVASNPVFKFLFTNKIGGIITLLFGGGSGLMAEAEFDSQRLNAEKIYEELERRREQKLKKQTKKTGGGNGMSSSKKKRRSGKEKKRLAAISEVVMDDVTDTTSVVPSEETTPVDSSTNDEAATTTKEAEGNEKKGVFGKMKDLYEKADSMAASQALIMNKNLEEAGVVEKITDETGLKVIGREEAQKLEENKTTDEKK